MAIETIFAAIGTWILKNYAKDVADKSLSAAKAKLSEKWAVFSWQKAAKDYKEKVKYLYGTIRILGNPKPVQLEGIFTDVFILDKPSAFQRFDIEELKEQFSKNRYFTPYTKRQDGLSLVSKPENHHLFILGKPGGGKTTFLKYIVLQAVAGHIPKIPIFVSLKEWSDSDLDLLPFIAKQLKICNFPEGRPFIEHLLQIGQAIVLFDGLDEVSQANNQRDKVIATLDNFSKQYHTVQCLITCRIAATDYSFGQFTYVEIADFNNEQMRTFVKKWFPDKDVQDKFFAEFFRSENEGLRELGRIPLLLTLLCLAFEETLTFPQRRIEVYEEALDALLKKWDSSRKIKRDEVYCKLSLGRKRQLLARIAAETFDEGEYFLRRRKLEKQIVNYLQKLPPLDVDEDIDGEAVLKSMEAQHGILVERAGQIYSFSHLSLQEYFTAKYIVDNAAKGTLEALINKHLTNDRWREIFLNTASLLDDADIFFVLFQQAINRLITDDEKLIKILKWAEKKATKIGVSLKPPAVRGIYCSLILDKSGTRPAAWFQATAFANALKHLELDNDSNLVIEFACQLNQVRSEFARGFITDIELAVRCIELYVKHMEYYLNNNLDITLTVEIALTNILDLVLLFSRRYDYYDKQGDMHQGMQNLIAIYFDELLSLIHRTDLSNLGQSLKLTIPSKNAPQTAWKVFANDLQSVLTTHLDIGYNWDLSIDQARCFVDYFKANQLFSECLELAYVSDRTGLESNLVLPPEGQ